MYRVRSEDAQEWKRGVDPVQVVHNTVVQVQGW
jgi:hypothetical protein